MKLPEPDLSLAFQIVDSLGFDKELMAELLPVSIQGIKAGLKSNERY